MITPQEKALELVNMYIADGLIDKCMSITYAKQCALLTVNEIWKALESARVFEEYEYWQQVKNEIEKIK
jgi:hypothetical protein